MLPQGFIAHPFKAGRMTQRQLQMQRDTGVGNLDLQIMAQHAQQFAAAQSVFQF